MVQFHTGVGLTTLALLLVVVMPAHAVLIASDSASDSAYADGWQGQNPDDGETPGMDNGGSGFEAWDFAEGFWNPDLSPYSAAHFISGVDEDPTQFNDLGEPAWGLTNANQGFFNYTARAKRPLLAPLEIGHTVSVDFDSPEVLAGLGGLGDPAGLEIELFGPGGENALRLLAQTGVNGGNWTLFSDDLPVNTGINVSDTSDGSTVSFMKTGADHGILTVDGQVFSVADMSSDGQVTSIRFSMFSNGSGDAASPGAATGEREFFFNNLTIVNLRGDMDLDADLDFDDIDDFVLGLGDDAAYEEQYGLPASAKGDCDGDGDIDFDDIPYFVAMLSGLLLPGNMDLDGDVDFDDIDDFVLGLNDPNAYQQQRGLPAVVNGDIDQDGDIDFDDIPGFVVILSGGGVHSVPEPSTRALLILAGAMGMLGVGARPLSRRPRAGPEVARGC
jgi:hypothetical protein